MKGTKKFRFLKRIVALVMVAFMLVTVPVLEGEPAKAATVVNIPDANLKAGINDWLGQAADADITDAQLAAMSGFSAEGVNDLTGIEYCTNLTYLTLSGGDSNLDLSKLSSLKKVKNLYLEDIKSTDYSPVSSMSGLESLGINDSDITKLPDMSAAPNLTLLNLVGNESLTDISTIKNCSKVESIYFSYFSGQNLSLSDITPLKNMNSIKNLYLSSVLVTEANKNDYMDTVASLSNLEVLKVSGCQIGDEHTAMFKSLSKLKELDLSDNEITDLAFLKNNKSSLQNLNISQNAISDGSDLSELTNLVELQLSYTNITDFSFVSKLPNFSPSWPHYSQQSTYGGQYNVVEGTGASTYAVKNLVKDHNGNYVAPVASDDYTYDSETNEIHIKLGDEYDKTYDAYIEYNIDLKSVKGEDLYVSHELYYFVYNVQPLEITKQPESQTVKPGDSVEFSVQTIGRGSKEYQWYKDDVAIDSPIGNRLSIYNVDKDDVGEYYVVITDEYGNEKTSDKVKLSINVVPLVITSQPVDYTTDEGDEIYFSVVATGDGELTYQWYKDGVAIDGATDRTYTKQNATDADAGKYYVVVSDDFDSAESDEAEAVVNLIPLEITTEPNGISIDEDGDGTLEVVATGNGTLTYQWFKDDKAIDGATTATLDIKDASASDEGKYYVVVKDIRNTVTSDKVDVEVTLIPLEITTQPVGATLTEGVTTSLTVKATGKGTLTYQWYKGDKAIEGATKDTLSLESLKPEDSGEYYVVVKDERNTVTSSKAVVTVNEKSTESTTQAPGSDVTTQAPGTDVTTNAPSTDGTTQAPVDGPKTGDGPIPAVCVTLVLAAMASVVLAKLRKNNI